MKDFSKEILNNFVLILRFVDEILINTFKTDDSLISTEGNKILNNDEDRRKIEEAVDYLKSSKDKIKTVELSNNRSINISIS